MYENIRKILATPFVNNLIEMQLIIDSVKC